VLARHAGQALTFEVLLRRAWGDEFLCNVGTVSRHVLTLRRALGSDPSVPRIESVSGVGYRMVLDGEDSRPTTASGSETLS
jgi:DNA-binding response OmpR family regulator